MRRTREDDIGASELGWMFETSKEDMGVPVPELTSLMSSGPSTAAMAKTRTKATIWSGGFGFGSSNRAASTGRRGQFGGVRGRGVKKAANRLTITTWTSLIIAFCMFFHELVSKSLSNGFVLVTLLIPPVTVLYIVIHRWEHKVKAKETVELFFRGFGPGFLLLLFTEMVCGLTLLGYYCYGSDCTATMDLLSDLRGLPEFFLLHTPVRGLMFAFVLSFFMAGLLEESTKLFFVSNSIEFAVNPQYDHLVDQQVLLQQRAQKALLQQQQQQKQHQQQLQQVEGNSAPSASSASWIMASPPLVSVWRQGRGGS